MQDEEAGMAREKSVPVKRVTFARRGFGNGQEASETVTEQLEGHGLLIPRRLMEKIERKEAALKAKQEELKAMEADLEADKARLAELMAAGSSRSRYGFRHGQK